MDAKKFDVFGRELPPEKSAPVKPSPEKGQEPATPETTGPQPGDITIPPSLVNPESPAEKPDAGPVVPSQIDPEPPLEDNAVPSRLEFIQLRDRVERLEEFLFEKDAGEDAEPPQGG